MRTAYAHGTRGVSEDRCIRCMCIRSCQFSAQAFRLGDTTTHDDVSADIVEGPALEAEVDEGLHRLNLTHRRVGLLPRFLVLLGNLRLPVF